MGDSSLALGLAFRLGGKGPLIAVKWAAGVRDVERFASSVLSGTDAVAILNRGA